MEPSSAKSLSANGYIFAAQHVALSDSQWSLWRWSILRGAGFPVSEALRLAVWKRVMGR